MGKSGKNKKINIGVVTTSRADWGIYLPLLKKIKSDPAFNLLIFAGGMHTDSRFGLSYRLIEKDGFGIQEKIVSLEQGYTSMDISKSIAGTIEKFTPIWERYNQKLDCLLALGDRYEMFSACTATIPFNIKIAHLHGGEITLGAIDNKFRNAITCMSVLHFTSNSIHADRVKKITGDSRGVYNVGSLGVEGALDEPLFSVSDFLGKFKFDIGKPFILTTIHPETVQYKNNKKYIVKFIASLKKIDLPVLCTLPNADTGGNIVREALLNYEKKYPGKIKCFENLGQRGYYTAMKHCSFMMGNTSSGIIEAGAYNKMVINLGDRQKGRITGENVLTVPFKTLEILKAVDKIKKNCTSTFRNPYGRGGASLKIIKILKTL